MKRLMIASIVLAMAVPAFAQSTRTQPQNANHRSGFDNNQKPKGRPGVERVCAGHWRSADCHETGHAKRRSDAHTCASPLNLSSPPASPLKRGKGLVSEIAPAAFVAGDFVLRQIRWLGRTQHMSGSSVDWI
jgi:hypothetical protein